MKILFFKLTNFIPTFFAYTPHLLGRLESFPYLRARHPPATCSPPLGQDAGAPGLWVGGAGKAGQVGSPVSGPFSGP